MKFFDDIRIGDLRKLGQHQFTADEIRLPLSLAQGLPAVQEINAIEIRRGHLISGRVEIVGPP